MPKLGKLLKDVTEERIRIGEVGINREIEKN